MTNSQKMGKAEIVPAVDRLPNHSGQLKRNAVRSYAHRACERVVHICAVAEEGHTSQKRSQQFPQHASRRGINQLEELLDLLVLWRTAGVRMPDLGPN